MTCKGLEGLIMYLYCWDG